MDGNDGVIESVNEAKFFRLPAKLNAMYNLKNAVDYIVGKHENGDDYKPAEMKTIEALIKKIKRAAKSFTDPRDAYGTIYESIVNEYGGRDSRNLDEKKINEYAARDLDEIFGALGYRQGFNEFIDDNPGCVEVIMEWIGSIKDFQQKLSQEYDDQELEDLGFDFKHDDIYESVVNEARRLSFRDAGITNTMDLNNAMNTLRDSGIDWDQKGQAFMFASSKDHTSAIKALGVDESAVNESNNTSFSLVSIIKGL